jgi:hypothetical protein
LPPVVVATQRPLVAYKTQQPWKQSRSTKGGQRLQQKLSESKIRPLRLGTKTIFFSLKEKEIIASFFYLKNLLINPFFFKIKQKNKSLKQNKQRNPSFFVTPKT